MRIHRLGLLLLLFSTRGVAQEPTAPPPGPWGGRVPVLLAEHASGGEAPLMLVGLSFLASAATDIVAAPGSARWHNERFPGDPPKSPGVALGMSFAATTLPVAAGMALVAMDAYELGTAAAFAGLVVGPSAGHWYAERPGRGWMTVGLRAGISAVAMGLYMCCT